MFPKVFLRLCIYRNNLLSPNHSGWYLAAGFGINDAGQITGVGYINNQTHAFLLSPVGVPAVPEPEEYLMLLVGGAMLAFQVRRKQKLIINTL